MELNVKNCLGPSSTPIHEELMLHQAWMDDAVQWVPDIAPEFSGVEGTHVYNVSDDEFEWVGRRLTQLEDLVDMRSKLPWADIMHTRSCPCGMTNSQWQAYQDYMDYGGDPMGDYMGRNE